MSKFTKIFGMTYAKKGTYGVPEPAETEVNRRSGKLKGLTRYLLRFHPPECGGQKTTTTEPSQLPILEEVATTGTFAQWQYGFLQATNRSNLVVLLDLTKGSLE